MPKTFTDDEAQYMTQSATQHWLSIDCWTCELRSDKNSYRRPRSVDRTYSRRLTSECLFLTACSIHGRIRRREENIKEFNCTQWYYMKPKQLIIKDCARRFVLKLYRHEASRGLFATAELLVLDISWGNSPQSVEFSPNDR